MPVRLPDGAPATAPDDGLDMLSAAKAPAADRRLQSAVGLGLATPTPAAARAGTSRPPPAVVGKAKALVAAYRAETEIAVNAIFADCYADFIDTFGNTDRIRPHDAAAALLRLNACLWSVEQDLARGALRPKDFGKSSWQQVGPAAVYDLGLKRLDEGGIDFDATMAAMLADRAWKATPIRVRDPEGNVAELTPESVSFWHRSILSTLAPSSAAASFEARGFAQRMRTYAVAAAAAPPGQEEARLAAARIGTAYALFEGSGVPPNASQVVQTVAAVTGTPTAKASLADPGASEQSLQALVEAGRIGGYTRVGPTFVVFELKSVAEIAAEVLAKADARELDYLGPQALGCLRQMMGPKAEPGAVLSARLEAEGSSCWWRTLGSEAIQIAAIGLASGGVGSLVEAVGVGARASLNVVRAARFVANAATFTTLSGAMGGEIDPARYPVDMLMFAVLGMGGRFAGLAKKLVPGSSTAARLAQVTIGHATSTLSATAIVTGFSLLEATACGQSASWQSAKEQLGRNLALMTILHGINVGFARLAPATTPGSVEQRQLAALRERLVGQGNQLLESTDALSSVLAQAKAAPEGSPEHVELAQRAETLMRRIDEQRGDVEALETDFRALVQRTLGLPQARALLEEAGITTAPEPQRSDSPPAGAGRPEGAPELVAMDPWQQRGLPSVADCVAALHSENPLAADQIRAALVKQLGTANPQDWLSVLQLLRRVSALEGDAARGLALELPSGYRMSLYPDSGVLSIAGRVELSKLGVEVLDKGLIRFDGWEAEETKRSLQASISLVARGLAEQGIADSAEAADLAQQMGLFDTKRVYDLSSAGPPLSELTEQQKSALRKYSVEGDSPDRDGYREINAALRSRDAAELERLAPTIHALEAALTRLPKYEGTVYRTTDLTPEQLAQYTVGTVMTERGFASTSTGGGVANRNGGVMFVIAAHERGRDITEASVYRGEREVLFLPGTRFKVLGRDAYEVLGRVRPVIYLEEVP